MEVKDKTERVYWEDAQEMELRATILNSSFESFYVSTPGYTVNSAIYLARVDQAIALRDFLNDLPLDELSK